MGKHDNTTAVCVHSTRRHPALPRMSVLVIHPRETQTLRSQNYDTAEILHWNAANIDIVGNAMPIKHRSANKKVPRKNAHFLEKGKKIGLRNTAQW